MRSQLLLGLSALVLMAGPALAQPAPMMAPPVNGVVKSVAAGHVVLTTATGDVDLALDPKVRVMRREPASTSEIKPGAYLGTANLTAPDGVSNTATEVHLMADGPNVHRAMSPEANPALMMTNGRVKSVVQTAKGHEMDVDYGGATTRHVVVAKGAEMTFMREVGVAALQPGVAVQARTAPGADGRPVAMMLMVTDKK